MSSISIYVLNEDCSYRNQRIGDIDSLMLAVDIENLNYTLQSPPSFHEPCYWYNNQWNDTPKP